MRTFIVWMHQKVAAAQSALLKALAYKDDLQFVQAPKIQREYMQKIGHLEQEAMQKELDASLMEKKQRMIQACINRREKVDMEMIDAQLNKEREEILRRANAAQVPEQPVLSPKEEEELRSLYKEIVETFHPSIRPDLNDTQKALFEHAVEAYQHQDLTMMKLIHEMLTADTIEIELEISMSVSLETVSPEQSAKEMADALMVDYTLAEAIFPHFNPMQEDQVLQQTAAGYLAQCNAVLEDIKVMLSLFPFSARETLADEQKIEQYLAQIRLRIAQADADIAEYEEQIARLMEEAAHG